mgnify:CR=1 FL=1
MLVFLDVGCANFFLYTLHPFPDAYCGSQREKSEGGCDGQLGKADLDRKNLNNIQIFQ